MVPSAKPRRLATGALLVVVALAACGGSEATITICGRGDRAALRAALAGGGLVLTFRGAGGEVLGVQSADAGAPTRLDAPVPDGARRIEVEGVDGGGAAVARGSGAVTPEGGCVCLALLAEHELVCDRVSCRSAGEGCRFEDASGAPPCALVGEGETVVDESGSCFTAGGTEAYLRHVADGWDGTLIWTHTTDDEEIDNFGRWELVFEGDGRYRVEAYTLDGFGQSRRAAYEVVHGSHLTVSTIDQSAVDGWNPLGEFDFDAGDAQRIRLADNTGEPGSSMTRLVFDALRITRVGDRRGRASR